MTAKETRILLRRGDKLFEAGDVAPLPTEARGYLNYLDVSTEQYVIVNYQVGGSIVTATESLDWVENTPYAFDRSLDTYALAKWRNITDKYGIRNGDLGPQYALMWIRLARPTVLSRIKVIGTGHNFVASATPNDGESVLTAYYEDNTYDILTVTRYQEAYGTGKDLYVAEVPQSKPVVRIAYTFRIPDNTDPGLWGTRTFNHFVITPAEGLTSLDVPLSSRASETTLQSVLAQLDVALSTRASESTLSAISGNIDVLLSSRASEATLSAISGNMDVALSTRASEATLSSILSQLDVALSTRASEATQKDYVAKNLEHLIRDTFALNPMENLKFSGDFTTGTYQVSYTPLAGEVVYIHRIILNSYAGRGELRLYWGTDIIAQCSVDASYYEMNAESEIQRAVVGDGTTALMLELVVNASTSYFAKAVARKVDYVEVV